MIKRETLYYARLSLVRFILISVHLQRVTLVVQSSTNKQSMYMSQGIAEIRHFRKCLGSCRIRLLESYFLRSEKSPIQQKSILSVCATILLKIDNINFFYLQRFICYAINAMLKIFCQKVGNYMYIDRAGFLEKLATLKKINENFHVTPEAGGGSKPV